MGLILILNYYSGYQFLMAQLFFDSIEIPGELFRTKMDYSEKGFSKSQSFRKIEVKNDVQWNSFKSLKLNLHYFLPQWLMCCCCKQRQQDRIRQKSYDMVMHETSVSYIIQQLRVLNAACKENRTDKEWQKLKDKYALIAFEDF